MSSIVRFAFDGGKQIEAALARMERKTARNVVTRAVRKAQTPLRDAIRQRIKSELVTMNAQARAQYAKGIGITTRQAKQGGVVGKVRTASKKVKLGNRITNFQPLAHLFERGVSPHQIKQKRRTIQHPGIRAIPIWVMTYDKMANRMVVDLRQYMFSELSREWNKK